MAPRDHYLDFDFVPMKKEGSPIHPMDLDWECDIALCEKCHAKYLKMLKAYKEFWEIEENN